MIADVCVLSYLFALPDCIAFTQTSLTSSSTSNFTGFFTCNILNDVKILRSLKSQSCNGVGCKPLKIMKTVTEYKLYSHKHAEFKAFELNWASQYFDGGRLIFTAVRVGEIYSRIEAKDCNGRAIKIEDMQSINPLNYCNLNFLNMQSCNEAVCKPL